MSDRSRYSIIPIGSLHTGWALKLDGIIRRSGPSLIPLGAYVDASMAGASVTMGFRQHGYMGALFGFACALDRGIPQASLDQESPS